MRRRSVLKLLLGGLAAAASPAPVATPDRVSRPAFTGGGRFIAFGSDTPVTLHGLEHVVLLDEVHAHRDRRVFDSLTAATRGRQ